MYFVLLRGEVRYLFFFVFLLVEAKGKVGRGEERRARGP
jgi:hypothetical protein